VTLGRCSRRWGVGALAVLGACGSEGRSSRGEPATPSAFQRYSTQRMGPQVATHFVIADTLAANTVPPYANEGRHICREERICNVLFWASEADAARSLPMTDAQVAGIVAQYWRNESTGLDRVICSAFGAPEEHCASGQ
jgi:hypothetical protein